MNRLDELERGSRLERDLDARPRRREVLEGAWDARGQGVRHVADPQPRPRRLVRVAGGELGDLGLVEHAAGLHEQGGAGHGERHAAVGPVEQADSELGLELADLLAHGRLRDVQTLGGAAEVQLLGDRDEVPQMS